MATKIYAETGDGLRKNKASNKETLQGIRKTKEMMDGIKALI